MQHFESRVFVFTCRLLVVVCLLFATAEIAFSQTPQISISDVTLTEGDDPAHPIASDQVKISLSAPNNANIVSVTVSTQDGTAKSNVDYGPGSTVVTFQPGETLKGLDVFPIGNTIVDGTRNFFLNLSNPVNATIARGQAMATIVDDDALILLTQPTSRSAALDSVLFTKETLPIANTLNFSSDNRTRIIVFAIGWKGTPITATAEDPLGHIIQLDPPEFVDKLPVGNTPKSLSWLTQVVLRMPDPNQVPSSEDLKIRITSGKTSNGVLVNLKPQ